MGRKKERRTARGFCFGDQMRRRLLVLRLVGSKLEKSELDAEHPAALIWGVRMFSAGCDTRWPVGRHLVTPPRSSHY